jgi:hypothetical protein
MLGSQLWIEREAGSDDIERLVEAAAESGLRLLRIFLIWPWIEAESGAWDFEVFDHTFDAAARHGIRIKATLTANSGPWHVGTPGTLHSHTLTLNSGQRPAMRRYVERSVRRYATHPALGQWVLWNEPGNPIGPLESPHPGRSAEQREAWGWFLKQRYAGDVERLNSRWLTGYQAFSDAGFPEEIPHSSQAGSDWQTFGPWLDEWRFRAAQLADEMRYIATIVREVDPITPLCVNPSTLTANHAAGGLDLPSLAEVVDVLGASFHPAWTFTFAPPKYDAALIAAGTAMLRSASGADSVEVTEIQTGNTYLTSRRPSDVPAAQIAAFHLAPLLTGASSVTGWCLNTRRHDNEAGDWALLDDFDQPSSRSAALRSVYEAILRLREAIGPWRPAPPRALVLTSPHAQAVDLVQARVMDHEDRGLPGRAPDDAVQGALLLTTLLLEAGVPTAPCPVERLRRADWAAGLIVASHLGAWQEGFAEWLLAAVDRGSTLILDATSGRKDLDATMHRPWPGGLTDRLGFRARGLTSHPDGHPVSLHGLDAGAFPLVRLDPELSPGVWRPWPELRHARDGAPCVWEREFGQGRVVLVGGPLGPALVHDQRAFALGRHLLARVAAPLSGPVRALSLDAVTLEVRGDHGRTAAGIIAPALDERQGRPLRVRLPRTDHVDLWTRETVHPGPDGEATMLAIDGIALLVKR